MVGAESSPARRQEVPRLFVGVLAAHHEPGYVDLLVPIRMVLSVLSEMKLTLRVVVTYKLAAQMKMSVCVVH